MARILVQGLVLCAGLLLAGGAGAQGLSRSLVPPVNPLYGGAQIAPGADAAAVAAAATPGGPTPHATLHASPRPRARPPNLAQNLAIGAASPGADPEAQAPRRGLLGLLRPKPRPEGAQPAALRDKPLKSSNKSKSAGAQKAARAGSVCGVAAIKGTALPPIQAALKGCGVADPVRVTSVAGVALQPPPTLDCTTARALTDWVERGLQPSLGARRAVELQIAAGYVCRTRNNVRGAKISEHGRGKAVDIAAVTRSDGSVLRVAGDFRALRRAHKAACGIFGTTLGPGSDGYHEDHMHFDTASHRGGAYCR